MSVTVRIGLFAALLALVFGGALAAGSAVDPDPAVEGQTGHEMGAAASGHGADGSGLRLVADDLSIKPGRPTDFRYRIVGRDGRVVRDFEVEHERRMHFIVVRGDLSGFQHLHPRQARDGSWVTDLRVAEAGSYRVFADFKRRGESQTVGADVHVAGDFVPRELPHPKPSATTDTGYEVRLARDGEGIRFTVFLHGRRVDDVEPYLGARGHLVALREGDLAFLHVHPESKPTEGRDIRFRVEYPSNGRYRLFLQFKHRGAVHTAAFTQEVGDEHGD